MALALLVALSSGPGVTATSHDRSDGAPAAVAAAAAGGELVDIAWNLDFDIERIFRFVADEIRYEPYVGILRGARGTLEARAGNSVDQALLLAALFDESAVPYRFARGPLDEATAAGLIDSIATDAAEARRIIENGLARGLDEFADTDAAGPTPSGPLVDRFEEETRVKATEVEARLELAESRLGDTVTMLEAALDEAGIGLPADGASLPPAEVDDHTWLQIPFGAEWLDLDPTLATAEPGTVLTAASETLDRLPDDLRHRVEFEVLVERVQGARLVTDSILEYAAFADELTGVPVMFSHIAPSAVERFGITLANLLGDGQIDYRPTLGVGPISHVADEPVGFGLEGVEGGGGLFEGTDLFDDGASSGDHAGPADGEATAEWLTVTVTRPGSEPAVARRTVFDRLPAQLRHGGEATVEAVEAVELIYFDGTGSTEFLPMLGIEAFAVATGPTAFAALLALFPDNELGTVALSYHVLRDALGAGMAIDAGARTFLDGPNIVSFSLDVDESAPLLATWVGLDIWHRNFGILPMSRASKSVAEVELVAGITGHIAERIAIEGLAGAPGLDQRAIGVGALFEAAAIAGVPTVVFHSTVPDPLPYGPMATALIEETVGTGDIVVVPVEPVIVDDAERVGWWRIDPATGVTTDAMDDASGQATVEYTIQFKDIKAKIACKGAYAKQMLVNIAYYAGEVRLIGSPLWAGITSKLGRVYYGPPPRTPGPRGPPWAPGPPTKCWRIG